MTTETKLDMNDEGTKAALQRLWNALRESGDATTIQLSRYTGLPREYVEAVLEEAVKLRMVRKPDRKHWRANPPPPTREEQRANAEEEARHWCERRIEWGKKERETLIANLSKENPVSAAYEAFHAMEWGYDFARQQHEAHIAGLVLAEGTGDAWAESFRGPEKLMLRVAYYRDQLKTNLLRNHFRPCSTGVFHNAGELVKADVAARIVELFDRLLREYPELEKELKAL